MGANNAAELSKAVEADYWLATHDERKIARGFVSLVLGRQEFSVEQAEEQLSGSHVQLAILGVGDEFAV